MGYSAQVDLQLRIDGVDYELCKTGPDFMVFREPMTISAGEGVLTVTVDGRKHETAVLVHGCANELRMKYSTIEKVGERL